MFLWTVTPDALHKVVGERTHSGDVFSA
jgi:hypothetical protein